MPALAARPRRRRDNVEAGRPFALGLDMGGTAVKAGVVSSNGIVVSRATVPSGEGDGVDAWARAGIAAARIALDRAAEQVVGVGLAIPGAVDRGRLRLVDLVARLPTEHGLDLTDVFEPLRLPVAAANDASAALEAEVRWGGHPAVTDIVVLTIGTGIGSAVRLAGRTLGGSVLAGNQLGHLTIEHDGETCVCGNTGCAETVASAKALIRGANALGLAANSASDVFDADTSGDPRAAAAIARQIEGLTATIVNAIHAYQPQIVVLGGGVMARADRLLPALQAAVAKRAWTLPRGAVPIVASRFGSDLGLIGGAALVFGGPLEIHEVSRIREASATLSPGDGG
jgi:glucokinase